MERMLDKFTSGRFWLTIITGIVFAYAVYSKVINAEATAAIITLVFMAYFQKSDRNLPKGGAV